jgi:hypothetical protein
MCLPGGISRRGDLSPEGVTGSAGVRCQETRAQLSGPVPASVRSAAPGLPRTWVTCFLTVLSATRSWRCDGRSCPRRAAAAPPARSRSAARPGPARRSSACPRRRRPGRCRAGGQAAGCARWPLVAADYDLSLAARQPRPSCVGVLVVACAAQSRRARRVHRPRLPRAPAASALRRGRRSAPDTPGTKP